MSKNNIVTNNVNLCTTGVQYSFFWNSSTIKFDVPVHGTCFVN